MKVVIVEDEELAAERLAGLLREIKPAVEIVASLDSVEEAVGWFRNYPSPDLAFFDIQLADGLSFEILEQCELGCPIIFTTAYDDYALKAFKVNSIDYILKPFNREELEKAFQQYEKLKQTFGQSAHLPYPELAAIRNAVKMLGKQYKSRFMVRVGQHLISVPVADVLFFYHENKMVYLKKKDLKKHAVDFTLEQLEELLDPAQFFRLNRKFIAAYEAVEEAVAFSNSRLKIKLKGVPAREQILVSRNRVLEFKEWLDQ